MKFPVCGKWPDGNEKDNKMRTLKMLSSWCYRVVNLPVLIASLVIFVLFMVLVLPNMAGQLTDMTGIAVSPDTSFVYSTKDLYAMAEAYGEEGRAYYVYSRFTFDLIWPAVYLFFLMATITYLFRFLSPEKPLRLVNLLPFAGVFLDLLENSAASLVMYRYPLPSPFAAFMAPVFTLLKWIFIGLSFVALISGLIVTVVCLCKKSQNN
jgi:hypothetical protein